MTRRQILQTAVFIPVLTLVLSGQAKSDYIVAEGYDLFLTPPEAMFPPGVFKGVPIGNFDFGGTIGVKHVGNTDTIIHRLADADTGGVPGTDTIPIEMIGLQLATVSPVDYGAGLDDHFVTIQSARYAGEVLDLFGAPLVAPTASTGTIDMTIASMAGGTFDSSLDVHFDLRKGLPFPPMISGGMGNIIASGMITLTSTGQPWGRIHAPGIGPLIDGVNHFLKGDATHDQDFWGVPDHTGPHPVQHVNPEPSTLVLCGFGLICAAGYRRCRRRQTLATTTTM